jgi:hypothetical protein
MPKDFPCPNPACTHTFPAESVAAASVLACPKCGSVLPLRSQVAAAVPKASVVAPPRTPASSPADVRPNDSLFALDPHAPATRGGLRRHVNIWLRAGVVLLFVLVAALGGIGIWKLFPTVAHEEGPVLGDVIKAPQANCQLIMPSTAWQEDEGGAKGRLKALLVMRRDKPRAWLALLVKDYKDHPADEAEIRNEALRRLGNLFNKENLESERGEDTSLAGLPAQHLVFRGEVDGINMSGDCHALAHRGLTYWLITWAPTSEMSLLLRQDFEELGKRFRFLK